LKALIVERGAQGLFYNCWDLLDDLRNTYERKVDATEREMLAPIFKAEVLVLDELGAAKITDWAFDAIARVINARYNDGKTTIVTTNYANLPPLGLERDNFDRMREETLGDRIGERMRSRLQEMCVAIDMTGADFRQSVKKATFAHELHPGLTFAVLEQMVDEYALKVEVTTTEKKSVEAEPRGRERMGSAAAPDQPPAGRYDY
jgi:DNA replication protein DnaC